MACVIVKLHQVMAEQKIKITKNGPYVVSGGVPLEKETMELGNDGEPARWIKGEKYPEKAVYSLCRCGLSKTKPYCDGSHVAAGFDGTETAGHKTFSEMNDPTIGPELIMNDAEKFCSIARFCHRGGDAWTLTEHSDDPQKRAMAIQEAADCPSGRLVACDKKTGLPLEPKFTPSISITEDTRHKVSGPIWVKGGIPIESADGTTYETRNRVTLCRCGKTRNKPFCDGCHITSKFTDRT